LGVANVSAITSLTRDDARTHVHGSSVAGILSLRPSRRCGVLLPIHGKRHPETMGSGEVNVFLADLATRHHVSASTQNQALSAPLVLYQAVLERPLDGLGDVVRARRPTRLPVVLTRAEVSAVLGELSGTVGLMPSLVYGAGLPCSSAANCASRTSISSEARYASGMARAAAIA
jgi:site-specific recombinase XerD